MSTTTEPTFRPIRFLLVQESLLDRSLMAALQREGHEVGFLVPPEGLSPVPIAPNIPIMTTPEQAVDQFDPTVVMFPKPYVGPLATELIRKGRNVVGSSVSHHELASVDPRFGNVLLNNAGVPNAQSYYAETESDFFHLATVLEAHENSDTYYQLSYGPWQHYSCYNVQQLRYHAQFFNRWTGIRVTKIVASPRSDVRPLALMYSGKQRVPGVMEMKVDYQYHPQLGIRPSEISLGSVDWLEQDTALGKHLQSLDTALVALRYTGPLFLTAVYDNRDFQYVFGMTSSPPDGFWPAFWAYQTYRDGLGKALLHIGRHSLKSPYYPVPEPGRIGGAYAERVTLLPSGHGDGIGTTFPFQPHYSFLPEDLVATIIHGPLLGWNTVSHTKEGHNDPEDKFRKYNYNHQLPPNISGNTGWLRLGFNSPVMLPWSGGSGVVESEEIDYTAIDTPPREPFKEIDTHGTESGVLLRDEPGTFDGGGGENHLDEPGQSGVEERPGDGDHADRAVQGVGEDGDLRLVAVQHDGVGSDLHAEETRSNGKRRKRSATGSNEDGGGKQP